LKEKAYSEMGGLRKEGSLGGCHHRLSRGKKKKRAFSTKKKGKGRPASLRVGERTPRKKRGEKTTCAPGGEKKGGKCPFPKKSGSITPSCGKMSRHVSGKRKKTAGERCTKGRKKKGGNDRKAS